MKPTLESVRLWLRAFFKRRAVESDLDREMRIHLEMEVEQNVRLGMAPDEARRVALVAFGGVERYKESVRDERGIRWLDDIVQDFWYAIRSLRRTRGFAMVAILTLALGVGANSAVFTVVHGVLLRPLPFRDPERLVLLHYGAPDFDGQEPSLIDRHFAAVRDHARSYESVATFWPNAQEMTLTGAGQTAEVRAGRVSPELFTVLGVNPVIGRGFASGDGKPGGARVVVIGNGLWREHFGGDSHVIGKTVSLDSGNPFSGGVAQYTVIGVMPAGFDFPVGMELWIPEEGGTAPAGFTVLLPVVGRLKPSVTPEQARAELEAIARAVPPDAHFNPPVTVARVMPLAQLFVRHVERSLLVFAGAVAFVLLIACANVANLTLARAASRSQEMAVRATLGASRWRLIRQLLTENILISLLGAAVGIPLAVGGVRVLLAIAPAGSIPRVDDIRIDGSVLAFTFAVAMLTGLGFGMVPALQASGRVVGESLGHGTRMTAGRHSIRSALVVCEIALALVLLTGAGLMIRSFLGLRSMELGFQPKNVATMTVSLRSSKYGTAEQIMDFHSRVLAALARIPQQTAVGSVSFRPFAGGISLAVVVEGQAPSKGGAWAPTVSTDYFRAMRIPILSGRTFTAHEEEVASAVAVVSRRVADKAWPGQSAIGKRIAFRFGGDSTSSANWLTVVGVVGDIRQELTRSIAPTIYQPISQATALFPPAIARLGRSNLGPMRNRTYIVRTIGDPNAAERAMRAVVDSIDPELPVQSLTPMADLMAANRSEPLFQARLLTAFSFIALLLAAVGIYGVLAHSVTERMREIGIRLALGAEASTVVQMIVRRGAVLAVLGIAIGAVGALVTTSVLATFLYTVTARDPATFVSTALLLAAIVLIACFIPARRASTVDPIIALRAE